MFAMCLYGLGLLLILPIGFMMEPHKALQSSSLLTSPISLHPPPFLPSPALLITTVTGERFDHLINMAEGSLPERQTQLVPSDHGACIFTNDIIIEILSWVPGKFILRFRRVCKSWRTLISDPYFVRKQLSHAVRRINNNNNDNLRHLKSIDYESLLTLLVKNKHENVSRVVVPRCRKHKLPLVEPQRRFVQIMGSSNGLICLQINCLDVVLWNPCTGNANKLPKPTSSVLLPSFYVRL